MIHDDSWLWNTPAFGDSFGATQQLAGFRGYARALATVNSLPRLVVPGDTGFQEGPSFDYSRGANFGVYPSNWLPPEQLYPLSSLANSLGSSGVPLSGSLPTTNSNGGGTSLNSGVGPAGPASGSGTGSAGTGGSSGTGGGAGAASFSTPEAVFEIAAVHPSTISQIQVQLQAITQAAQQIALASHETAQLLTKLSSPTSLPAQQAISNQPVQPTVAQFSMPLDVLAGMQTQYPAERTPFVRGVSIEFQSP